VNLFHQNPSNFNRQAVYFQGRCIPLSFGARVFFLRRWLWRRVWRLTREWLRVMSRIRDQCHCGLARWTGSLIEGVGFEIGYILKWHENMGGIGD